MKIRRVVTITMHIESFEDVTELRQIEMEQEELLHDLGKRVKELNCMYEVADSIQRRMTLDEIFEDVLAIIPPAWHYRSTIQEHKYYRQKFRADCVPLTPYLQG